MHIAGVIAEYNPFHSGHAYQLAETRRMLGAETAIVCAMSGGWVQRGEAAIADPWTRARAALGHGADLVLLLPTVWSTASAEGFARGGVGVLAATGAVETLSFGSEAGELTPLRAAADCIDAPAYPAALQAALKTGVSFATARERAVRALIGRGADCLKTPNNNLAVEYLRALPEEMAAITIPRIGAGHDADERGEYASASTLRRLLLGGNAEEAAPCLPGGAPPVLAEFGHCRGMMLYRLRAMSPSEFEGLDAGGEGLGRRLYNAVRQAQSLEEVFDRAKCKRHAHARLRRMVLWAFLGLTGAEPPAIPYLHVLGMTARGREVLRKMKKTASVPVVTKPAHAARLDGAARRLFETEARCVDLFGLCFDPPPPCGRLWRESPVVV